MAAILPKFEPRENPLNLVQIDLVELESWLKLQEFEMTRVLTHGQWLAASKGTEFDILIDPNVTPKQRLAIQRKMIHEKLGIGTEFLQGTICINRIVDSLITEKDLTVGSSTVVEGDKLDLTDLTGLSAREKNRLKRKAVRFYYK
jgi:hypothetical protein